MKYNIEMETIIANILNTGYNPRVELMTNSYSTNFFCGSSAVNNTIAEIMKNRTIIISTPYKNYYE